MKLKLRKTNHINKFKKSEQGFSLVETMIALTTLGVCLAYAMPLFLYAKINNSKSEIRTGALIVSQRIFDRIRSNSISNSTTLTDGKVRDQDPSNTGNTTWKTGVNSDGSNPVLQPADMTTITDDEKLLTKAMGRQYRTKIIYCENYNLATTADPVCSEKYRKFKVEVSYNGSKVYDLEGTYTEFQ
jgi:prepilin-type N-terminal cleavage/methylation domain-containing protein